MLFFFPHSKRNGPFLLATSEPASLNIFWVYLESQFQILACRIHKCVVIHRILLLLSKQRKKHLTRFTPSCHNAPTHMGHNGVTLLSPSNNSIFRVELQVAGQRTIQEQTTYQLQLTAFKQSTYTVRPANFSVLRFTGIVS